MIAAPHQPDAQAEAVENAPISYRKRTVPFYRRPSVAAWAVIVFLAFLLTLYFLNLS
ncbi:hypothetical protein SAMN04488087_0664 [Rhodothermus profundi]|uniref:Uncharacterized protein n=1 Tax=Rhodothermus profundi TaxID=633813 RepID=A0A1M6QLC5_9BACT|nr:hypothetical protein SAMN04488087_0664 [Rhodothermus profundi]